MMNNEYGMMNGCRQRSSGWTVPAVDAIHRSSFITHRCCSVSPLGLTRKAPHEIGATTVEPRGLPGIASASRSGAGRRRGARRGAATIARAAILLLLGIINYQLSIINLFAQTFQQQEIPQPLSDRPLPVRFHNLSLEDGLSMSVGQSIFQDRFGFIWIGTQQGVNRYDGFEFKLYTNEPFNPNSFPEGWVLDINEDSEGNLWFGTDAAVSRMNRVDDSFTHWRHDPNDENSLGAGGARAVVPHKNGLVWIAGFEGLDLLDPQSNVVEHFRYDSTDQNSISSDDVWDVMQDVSGMTWISTRSGLSRIDPVTRARFDRVLTEPIATAFERTAEPGIIWAAGLDDLIRLDPTSGETKRYPYPSGHMRWGFGSRTKIVQDPVNRNVLWMNMFAAGLLRFDLRNERFIQYNADPDDPTSLSNDRTMTLYGDRSGTIWIGTVGNGVDRFNPGSADMEHVRAGPNPERGLPAPLVWGASTGPDGDLWVTTMDETGRGRLSRLNRETASARHYTHDPNNQRSLSSGGLLTVKHDGAGTLWVAGGGKWPLSRYDPATDSFVRVVVDPNSPNGVVDDAPARLFVDSQGALWVGTQGGLSRIDPSTRRFSNFPADPGEAGILADDIQAIAEDQSGTLWLGFWHEGLMAFDPVTGRTERFVHNPDDTTSICSNSISSLLIRAGAPGVLWIGTSVGLGRFDIPTGKSRRYSVEDGMPDDVVYELLEDDAGRIWMSTNRGLSRFDPETETFRNYGMEVGLQGLEFSLFASHKSATGELFFGGINGLNAFYPNQLLENSTPPEVSLVDLRLHNESISKSKAIPLEAPLPATKAIDLDYTQKDISFDFAALHFENPEKNTFAYKLEGYDDDWVMTGHHRTASFTNLSPGKYVFRVKAANSDGVWNEEGAALTIVIAPPFWATWWFRLLAILAIAGLLYAGYAFRVSQIAEHSRMLEAEVGRRTAELNESKERLELTNEQLEQSHVIVEAINQETSFRRLLTKILEESRVIPGVEKATALVRLSDDLFHVRASSGWDVADMQGIRLTTKQAHQRYVEQAEEVGKNIFVAKNVAERAGTEVMAEFGQVASFMILRVMVEGDVRAYLVFDNLSDPDAFDHRDVALLERLREHIQSAFIKTSILEDLQNTLNDLRSTQDRLIQSEKMASLGQLTAGIAHEIKNPLNFVNNFSDVTAELAIELTEEMERLREKLPSEELAELSGIVENLSLNAKKIGEHGKRADAIVKNMLEHSKVGEGERSPTDLNEMLDEYVTLARHGFEARGGGIEVKVERAYDQNVGRVDVVPQDMGRVFMNLLSNAFDVLKEYGAANATPKIFVSTAKVDGAVEIKVTDNGPGIPPRVKARIFEPFFTTKATGSGTGLGLSMSYDIVTKGHGGSLDVISEEGNGATFVVRLPI